MPTKPNRVPGSGILLRWAREVRGLTQGDLGGSWNAASNGSLPASRRMIVEWEQSGIPETKLTAVAGYFGVSVELFAREIPEHLFKEAIRKVAVEKSENGFRGIGIPWIPERVPEKLGGRFLAIYYDLWDEKRVRRAEVEIRVRLRMAEVTARLKLLEEEGFPGGPVVEFTGPGYLFFDTLHIFLTPENHHIQLDLPRSGSEIPTPLFGIMLSKSDKGVFGAQRVSLTRNIVFRRLGPGEEVDLDFMPLKALQKNEREWLDGKAL